MNNYDITIDLDKSRHPRSYAPIVLRRGESKGCTISAAMKDHGDDIDTDGLTPYLCAKMPTGAYYRQSGTWDGSVAVVIVDEAYFASEVGRAVMAYFEVRSARGDIIATSQDFMLKTLDNVVGDGELAEPYDSAIEDALEEIGEATDAANDLIDGFYASIDVLSDEDVDALFG